MAALERIGTILGGLGAAIAVPAGLAATPSAVATAVALPALGTGLTVAALWNAVRESRRGEVKAHIAEAIATVQSGLDRDTAYSRIAAANRRALEGAVADALEGVTADRAVLGALAAEADLDGECLAVRLHALAPPHDPTGRFADPDSDESRFFRTVVATMWEGLRAHPAVYATLRAAIDAEELARLTRIEAKLDRAIQQTRVLSRKLGLREGLVIGVARRYLADEAADFDAALRGIEAALQEAAAMRAVDALPANTEAAVEAVLARVADLNDAGRMDEATAALDRELAAHAERRAAEKAATARLLARGVTQARLTNAPEKAAAYLLEDLTLDAPPDPFDALRTVQDEWYERGRDKGITFDLEVAIALAEETCTRARDADQRGTALNDFGNALAILGERESDTDRLEQAVDAYRNALLERTRDRVPLDWAMTQNNLGNALQALGERESGTDRLEQAVGAFRSALLEYTRDRVPLYWATTQNNLGTALQTLGERESGIDRLEQAVDAYRSALLEYTRDRVPLDWAMTQNNLGNTLQTLGERESGTDRLEQAVDAFRSALLEYTRDRVPLDWAMTRMNMANALVLIGERRGDREAVAEAVALYDDVLSIVAEAAPAFEAIARHNLDGHRATLAAME